MTTRLKSTTKSLCRVLHVAAATLLLPVFGRADTGFVSVAAAANFTYVMDALNSEYRRVAPQVRVSVTFGASGNLFAQVINEAPFDIFLSADTHYPQELVRLQRGVPSTLHTFAAGRLALWTTRDDLPVSDIAGAVRAKTMRKVVIAQPRTAPYGRAAQAALERLGVWSEIQPRIVIGENIAQTAQFVETGNADAGFVAVSTLMSPRVRGRGAWTEIPPALYSDVSLDHAAIVTRRGSTNAHARHYLDFLQSEAARRILQSHGYATPTTPAK